MNLFRFAGDSEERECGAAHEQQRTADNTRVIWQFTNFIVSDNDC